MTSFVESIETLFAGRDSAVAKDLKLNFKKLTSEGSALTADEAGFLTLALGASLADERLQTLAREQLTAQGLPAAEIEEAREVAGIMGMLNKYYRFRHMLEAARGKEAMTADYRAAGLRMNSLAKPLIGKPRFELLSLAVSVVNGCEMCIAAHEEELRKLGTPVEKIHDAARLASVLSGVTVLLAA